MRTPVLVGTITLARMIGDNALPDGWIDLLTTVFLACAFMDVTEWARGLYR